MAAVYPGSVRVYTSKTDLLDTVLAEHVNLLQDEVTAVQASLGTGILTSSWTGSYTNPSSHASLSSRLLNIEAGIKNLESTKANITGSVAKWTTARTLTLNGDVSGSVSIDGSADVTMTVSASFGDLSGSFMLMGT